MSNTSDKKMHIINGNLPVDGLKDFFHQHNLQESRNTLWKWLNVSGSREFDKLDIKEREDLLKFYVHLHDLLDAAHKVKVTLNEDDVLQKVP